MSWLKETKNVVHSQDLAVRCPLMKELLYLFALVYMKLQKYFQDFKYYIYMHACSAYIYNSIHSSFMSIYIFFETISLHQNILLLYVNNLGQNTLIIIYLLRYHMNF